MNRLVALIAFLVLVGFLAILATWVPSPDLLIVIGLTIVLVGYDFITSSGKSKD